MSINVKAGGTVEGGTAPFLRYPGGKQRHLPDFAHLLPAPGAISSYVEPFLGGGAVFFYLHPRSAKLSDLNSELIDLYEAIRVWPVKVWNRYSSFPATKSGYYKIRSWDTAELDLCTRAARTLYLNRTCFKGMWRHNLAGSFNVGFGGEDRRAAATRRDLLAVSQRLRNVVVSCLDFEKALDGAGDGDFAFLDPPYRPGASEILHEHYSYGKFLKEDHERLAHALRRASARGVKWAMTCTSHPEILELYSVKDVFPLPLGTSGKIGMRTSSTGEVLLRNYKRVPK